MAHIWLMHDAHLGCALFFLDMVAEYTLLSMTVMVIPCLWYVDGMNLVCPMSKFPQAPFARAPFGECRQWFRPQPEVPCVATNLVGLILMFFSCESKPAARTSGTACNIELQSDKSSQDFWKTASPQHAQRDCHHLFRKVSEFSWNLPGISGTSPEFLELPRNFRNSGFCQNFKAKPIPESSFGTCPRFLELARNFRNFPGTFPEHSRNFPAELLGFLPKSFKNVTRAEPTQFFNTSFTVFAIGEGRMIRNRSLLTS